MRQLSGAFTHKTYIFVQIYFMLIVTSTSNFFQLAFPVSWTFIKTKKEKNAWNNVNKGWNKESELK